MTAGMFELAVVIVIAAALGIAAKFLKQPIILAYLATGAVIGYWNIFNVQDQATFQIFSDLGIMFLLFLIGLEINYASLRIVGKTSLILGVGQVLFTSVIGYALAALFGFEFLPALYIAIALTFSSTIIIVKLLSEKRDLQSLYGKISVGMLLVQDMIAIAILLVLAGLGTEDESVWAGAGATIVKGVSLFVFMLWVGRKFLPRIFDRAARYPELLFLLSLAWLFAIVAAVQEIGLPIEIAGFLAGLALANLSETFQIAGRIRPLRDFFILVFFVILGSSFFLSSGFAGITFPAIVFSLFVLIGNPLIVLAIMGFMGYRKRTGFLTGLTVAQISEFSLVLAALGNRLGHIESSVVSLITIVGIVTITLSTYLILYADAIFRRVHGLLRIFERRMITEIGWHGQNYRKRFVLIGAHRTGQSIAMSLPKQDVVIVDFDPEVIAELRRFGFDYVFGDIVDPEILDRIDFDAAELVVCTSPDIEDNLFLLSELLSRPNRPRIVMRAEDEAQAEFLYRYGADYVLLPNFTAGQYLGKTLALSSDLRILDELKKHDLMMLRANHGFVPVPPTSARGYGEARPRNVSYEGRPMRHHSPVAKAAVERGSVTIPPPLPPSPSQISPSEIWEGKPRARFAAALPPPPPRSQISPSEIWEGKRVSRKLPVHYS